MHGIHPKKIERHVMYSFTYYCMQTYQKHSYSLYNDIIIYVDNYFVKYLPGIKNKIYSHDSGNTFDNSFAVIQCT